MEDKNQPRMDQWTDFAGKYLKADMIDAFPSLHVVIGISSYFDDDDDAHLVIQIEYKSKKWLFELNKTNQAFIKKSGVKSPREIIGKKITFEKIKARNPSTKQMVDSLSIIKVE